MLVLLLAACISTPTAYSREAPMAVYPAGRLSGEPVHFVGWRVKF